jgi:hypothetical protein
MEQLCASVVPNRSVAHAMLWFNRSVSKKHHEMFTQAKRDRMNASGIRRAYIARCADTCPVRRVTRLQVPISLVYVHDK